MKTRTELPSRSATALSVRACLAAIFNMAAAQERQRIDT